jgi:hypothetical protein
MLVTGFVSAWGGFSTSLDGVSSTLGSWTRFFLLGEGCSRPSFLALSGDLTALSTFLSLMFFSRLTLEVST